MDKSTENRAVRRFDTPDVGISPGEYARRHMIAARDSTKGLIILAVAVQADPRTGGAHTTQRSIAEDMGKSLVTIKRAFQWLLSPDSGPALIKRRTRLYQLAGYLAHDPRTCGNAECSADVRTVGKSDRRRAQERERARRYRARKAAESH